MLDDGCDRVWHERLVGLIAPLRRLMLATFIFGEDIVILQRVITTKIRKRHDGSLQHWEECGRILVRSALTNVGLVQ